MECKNEINDWKPKTKQIIQLQHKHNTMNIIYIYKEKNTKEVTKQSLPVHKSAIWLLLKQSRRTWLKLLAVAEYLSILEYKLFKILFFIVFYV